MALLSNKLGRITTFLCDANTFFIHSNLIINKKRIILKNQLFPVKLGNEQKHTILESNLCENNHVGLYSNCMLFFYQKTKVYTLLFCITRGLCYLCITISETLDLG